MAIAIMQALRTGQMSDGTGNLSYKATAQMKKW